MAEMTKKQMEMLLKSDADRTRGFTQEEMDEMQQELDRQNLKKKQRRDEEMKEEFSPGLEEDRTAPLKEDSVPDRSMESPDYTRNPMDDASLGFFKSLFGPDTDIEKETVKKAGGGSVEKEADFVKDDDEEPADPPPGATPEEVADDIPAYLSTGEYVLPANVVRYLGLERIVSMHKGALSALQQMEDLDIIENVDENGMVEEDDDEMDYLKEPKGVVKTTLVVAKPHPSGMMAMPFQQGGDIGQDDTLGEDDESTPTDLGQDDTLGEESAVEMGDVGAFGGPDSPAEAGGVPADPGQDDDPGEDLMDFSTPMTMDDLDQMSRDADPGIAGVFKSAFNSAEKKLGDMRDKGQLVTGSIVGDAFIGLMSGIVDKARESGATIGDSDPAVDDTSIGGGDLQDKGIISEEDITPEESEEDQFKDATYQPGVGFVFPRRRIKRVKSLTGQELGVKKGGLMGY